MPRSWGGSILSPFEEEPGLVAGQSEFKRERGGLRLVGPRGRLDGLGVYSEVGTLDFEQSRDKDLAGCLQTPLAAAWRGDLESRSLQPAAPPPPPGSFTLLTSGDGACSAVVPPLPAVSPSLACDLRSTVAQKY